MTNTITLGKEGLISFTMLAPGDIYRVKGGHWCMKTDAEVATQPAAVNLQTGSLYWPSGSLIVEKAFKDTIFQLRVD